MPESASSWPSDRTWVTVLAGGVGSRLWPASIPSRPKPLLALAGPDPLVAETVARARRLVPDARLRMLTGEAMVEPIRAVVPGLERNAFLVEPAARGTAPVLVWAAHELRKRDPAAVIVSLHADHVVRPEEAFLDQLRRAVALADGERMLVTIGATPDRPETGFGHIQRGDAVADDAWRVARFHEKPDIDTAERYVAQGYLWNTGIFVWRADTFLEEVREHATELADALPRLEEGDVAGFFATCPSISVDVAVLERSGRVACMASAFQWDDVGGWEALARTHEADASGNVVVGDGHAIDASDNVVYAEGAPVALFGVEGLVVVRTPWGTLVTTRERAPDLKTMMAELPGSVRDPGTGEER